MNTITIDNNEFNLITSVYISFSNWIDNILSSLLCCSDVWGYLFYEEVVTDKLVVEDGSTKLWAGTLNTIGEFIVGTNSIVTEYDTLSVLVETAQEVERIEGHEAARVKGVTKELG